MNFFAYQDAARKSTRRLVLFFVLAVISLVVLTNILVAFFIAVEGNQQGLSFSWEMLVGISLVVIGVIAVGSLYKVSVLAKGGGAYVAESLNGTLLKRTSPESQKVLNVVEEIAIASGTPVPSVYLIPEAGINAFAAGYSPSDAVIGVTEGAVKNFNREQLQGVIAHEFSHIINGDMRLNIRLMGVLHGILLIGLIGYRIIRGSGASRSRRSKDSGGIVLFGLGLMAIGYGGTFFGNLIKASVSRQREFLADASAVQFTRNPNGIASALKRIAGYSQGSAMQNPKAAEISHALFGEGVSSSFSKIFATHPPINERIRRLDPSWQGSGVTQAQTAPVGALQQFVSQLTTAVGTEIKVDRAREQIGTFSAEHIAYAEALHQQLPANLVNACHDPSSARAVIYLLLLDKNPEIAEHQLAIVQKQAESGVWEELLKLRKEFAEIPRHYCMPLIEITLAALRNLSMNQYLRFKQNVGELIHIDNKVDRFEWLLNRMLFHHLDIAFQQVPRREAVSSLKQLRKYAEKLLSDLAAIGTNYAEVAKATFDAAVKNLSISLNFILPTALDVVQLDESLNKLRLLKPQEKQKLMDACIKCIGNDQKITPAEYELFRVIASTLDCPAPPLVG